jgi:SAM-dependent methyltransferase
MLVAPDGLVVGIDTSPVMLKQATRRNAQLIQQGQVQLQRASALALPFADATFDIALSANSVQLWPDQRAGVTEMRRVLKPDGQIALILQPIWVKTNDRSRRWVITYGVTLKRGFRSTICAFKEMKPMGACVMAEVTAVTSRSGCRHRRCQPIATLDLRWQIGFMIGTGAGVAAFGGRRPSSAGTSRACC